MTRVPLVHEGRIVGFMRSRDHARLKLVAQRQGVSIEEALRRALAAYFEEHGRPRP